MQHVAGGPFQYVGITALMRDRSAHCMTKAATLTRSLTRHPSYVFAHAPRRDSVRSTVPSRLDYFNSIKFQIVVGRRPPHATGTCIRCRRPGHRSTAASRWADQAPQSRETFKDHYTCFSIYTVYVWGANVPKFAEINFLHNLNKYQLWNYGILLFVSKSA